MNEQTKLIFHVGIYRRMQVEMMAIDLLDGNGVAMPIKNMSAIEKDGIAIYKHLTEKVEGLHRKKIFELAKFTDDIAKTLLNEETLINNYLLSAMLYRLYLQQEAPKSEMIMILPKVGRTIKMYEDLEGEEYAMIRKNTSRVADNMFRAFTGKPQLSDEIRDLRAKKFTRVMA